MSEQKRYTAQEWREAAVSPTYVGGVSEVRVKPEVYEMLEQAADAVEENAKLKAWLETVVNRIDKQICHPSESNCKRCGDHRGNCQCGSISNNEMMKLLNLAKGE